MRPQKRRSKVSSKFNASSTLMCFVCQEGSDGSEMKLLSNKMPHSKALILSKIESLLGRNFKIHVEKDDVVCECCYKLLVRVDKMEMVLKTFLSVKYNLEEEEEAGEGEEEEEEEKKLIFGTEVDPLQLSNDEDIFNVERQDDKYDCEQNDQSQDIEMIDASPKSVDEDHSYYSLPDLYDTEQNESNDTFAESGNEVEFNDIPGSSEIEPIDMNKHQKAVAHTSSYPFKCPKCNLGLAGLDSLRGHVTLHGKPVKCKICRKTAQDRVFLKIHIRQQHMTKVKERLKSTGYDKEFALTCSVCNFQTTTVNKLVRHMPSHNKKPSKCRTCKKTFPDHIFLRHHNLEVHPEQRQAVSTQLELNLDKSLRTTNLERNDGSETQEGSSVVTRRMSRLKDKSIEVTDDENNSIKGDQLDELEDESDHLESDDEWTPQDTQDIQDFSADEEDKSETEHKDNRKTTPKSKTKSHKCVKCGVVFLRLYSLKLHMRNRHDSKPVVCQVCDVEFEDKTVYKRHVEDEHNQADVAEFYDEKEKVYRCPQCGRVTNKVTSFLVHVKRHTGFLSSKCSHCDAVMPNRESLRKHWETAHPQTRGYTVNVAGEAQRRPGSVECDTCHMVLSSVAGLRKHLTLHNGVSAKCQRCGEVLADRQFLRQHQRAKHYQLLPTVDLPCGQTDDFKCPVCGRGYTTKHNLRQHLTCHNGQAVKCTRCGETLADRMFLRMHTKEVHLDALDARNYARDEDSMAALTCRTCDRQFLSQPSLARHMSGHDPATGPLKCRVCDIDLVDRLHQITHMRKEHRGANRPQFLCDLCPKAFHAKHGVERHIANWHRDMKCQVCGEEFRTLRRLRSHEQRHEQNGPKKVRKRPFLCAICGKSFLHGVGLREHMGVHEQVDRYTCEICGRTFVYKASLQMHKKWHDNPYPHACIHQSCVKRFMTYSHLQMHLRTQHSTERPFQCVYCPKSFNVKTSFKRHVMTHTLDFAYKCDRCDYGATRPGYLATHYVSAHGDHEKAATLKKKCEYKICLRPEEKLDIAEVVVVEEAALSLEQLFELDQI